MKRIIKTISSPAEVRELPFGTLLLDDRGNSYRLVAVYGEMKVMVQSPGGAVSSPGDLPEEFPEGFVLTTLVWQD